MHLGPLIAASVKTRVVSWKLAAEMNESADSDAFVIPNSTDLLEAINHFFQQEYLRCEPNTASDA